VPLTNYLTDEEKTTDAKLVNRLKDINDEIARLAEKDTLAADDEVSFAEHSAEFAELEAEQKKLHRDAQARHIAKAAAVPGRTLNGDLNTDPFGEVESIETRIKTNPWDLSEMRVYPNDPKAQTTELRSRAYAAIEQMEGASDDRRQAATKLLDRWDDKQGSISRLVLATSSPDYMSFWAKSLRYGPVAAFTPEEVAAANRAMSLTDAEGGFLIPFQLDPTVIITDDGSLNQIRQVARQVVATGDVWNGVSSGAVAFSWDAEASEASDDATTFAQPTIPIYKGVGFVPISMEALQDEANVTGAIADLLAFGKNVQDAAAFATGAGTTEPIGIVTALTGGASVVTSVTTDVYAVADLHATKAGLPARYRPNSSWLANDAIYGLTRQFAEPSGFWADLSGDRPPMLLSKPALESEDMDGTITALADNLVLILGDFSNYVIADRVGMTVETIPHLFATPNNRPSGQRGFYAHYRLGADSVNDGAFSMLNVT
jgi:HK97 family phage major capsid protein